jgi:hypothetical protein
MKLNKFTQIIVWYIDSDFYFLSKMMDFATMYKEGEYDLEDLQVAIAEHVTLSNALSQIQKKLRHKKISLVLIQRYLFVIKPLAH